MKWGNAVTYAWLLSLKVSRGHRYFTDAETKRVAVADDSGRTPDQTDDGVLWLDTSRPIKLGLEGADIPLLRPSRDDQPKGLSAPLLETWTGETLAGGLAVARTFGCKVKVDRALLDVAREVVLAGLEGRVTS